MGDKARLVMALHCHQPVFNFESEFDKAYGLAYLPFVRELEEHPGIKASFHFSGNLFEWLVRKHPEYVDTLKKLQGSGQIELIGGGYFEPIMTLLPERDRVSQLRLNSDLLERTTGHRPVGAWIAERVWEPALADTLAGAGMTYTIVDDNHFIKAGLPEGHLYKPCSIKGENGDMLLFPSLAKLRYSMPFLPPEATLRYIKDKTTSSLSEETCFFFADDCEKFGAWPHTHKWVYGKGWLRDFFEMLSENSGWLSTSTYSEAAREVAPNVVEGIPEASYAEMMQWSNGGFRNFLGKYPEVAHMYNRMLSVSDAIYGIEKGDTDTSYNNEVELAKKELFKAQTGCTYWHGTFGGVYLPHLRDGVYEHLIKAQNIIDGILKRKDRRIWSIEQDSDTGYKEVSIGNRLLDIYSTPDSGGMISEIDYRPLHMNVTNTLSRSREDYHKKLDRKYTGRIKQARKAAMSGDMTDIHDVLGVCDRGLKKLLFYDRYQKGCFLTHIFTGTDPWEDMIKNAQSHGGFLKKPYDSTLYVSDEFVTHKMRRRDKVFLGKGEVVDLDVVKKVRIGAGPAINFIHTIKERSDKDLAMRYALEFNFMVFDKRYASRTRSFHAEQLSVSDMYSGLAVDIFFEKKHHVFICPIYSVNETESGLKKTYQGLSVFVCSDVAAGTKLDEMNITVTLG
ncbi:MAG: DUF1926 domain-containing protein [Candidatus Omnitrophica bacterium]|nr:DUF1926 domain-containing protein [Candidatus Omnitrophota bacterium]MDD5487557.1 DUF1926 domain-containing protein [Candidatus Omnitrophota bacterium]